MRLAQRCAACALVFAATWLRAENLPNEIRILVPVTAGIVRREWETYGKLVRMLRLTAE